MIPETIEETKRMLEANESVFVTFRTKVGKIRVMECTRKLSSIPEEKREGVNTPVLNGEGIICVWDWLVSDWRAFRYDKIMDMTV